MEWVTTLVRLIFCPMVFTCELSIRDVGAQYFRRHGILYANALFAALLACGAFVNHLLLLHRLEGLKHH